MKTTLLVPAFFLISFFATAQDVDSTAIKQVDSLIQVSRELTGKNDFDKALEVNAAAEKLALEKLGPESAAFGNCCYNLGRVNYFKGDYPKTESLYLKAKAILEKAGCKGQAGFAALLSDQAVFYWLMGNYEKSEQLHLEAKAIKEKVLGKEHADYAQTLNDLALLYVDMGNYEIAETLYFEAKTIWEKTLGKEHPDYADNLNHMAVMYMRMGNYEKAEPLLLEANATRKKTVGKEHPDYLVGLKNLSGLYERQNRFSASEPLQTELFTLEQFRLSKSASFLSEHELANYATTFQTSGENLGGYLLYRSRKNQTGTLPAIAFSNALFQKGFLLTAAASPHNMPSPSPKGIQPPLQNLKKKPTSPKRNSPKRSPVTPKPSGRSNGRRCKQL